MWLVGVQGRKCMMPRAFAKKDVLAVRAAVITGSGAHPEASRGHAQTLTKSLHLPLKDVSASSGVNLELSPISDFYRPWSGTQTLVWSNAGTLSLFFSEGMKGIPGNISLPFHLSPAFRRSVYQRRQIYFCFCSDIHFPVQMNSWSNTYFFKGIFLLTAEVIHFCKTWAGNLRAEKKF